jgi:putative oxidoreductase
VNRNLLRILHWACRLILAGIFLYSGYVKIREPLQFAASLMAYQLLPATWIYPVAQYFPWAEVVLGIWLLSGFRIRLAATAASGLIVFFIVILTITYARGIEADCGCFGSGDRISPFTLLRDSLFLVPALFLVLEPRLRGRQVWDSGQRPAASDQENAGR